MVSRTAGVGKAGGPRIRGHASKKRNDLDRTSAGFHHCNREKIRKPGDTGQLTMQKMMHNCADAARRTVKLRNAKVSPGQPERRCRALTGLKYPLAAGLQWRARLLCPDHAQRILARQHKSRINQAGKGAWDWTPAYGNIPEPPWQSAKGEERAMQLFGQKHINEIQKEGKLHEELRKYQKVKKHNKGKKRPRRMTGAHTGGVKKQGAKLKNATRGVIQKDRKTHNRANCVI